jgi:hypothetical protein
MSLTFSRSAYILSASDVYTRKNRHIMPNDNPIQRCLYHPAELRPATNTVHAGQLYCLQCCKFIKWMSLKEIEAYLSIEEIKST